MMQYGEARGDQEETSCRTRRNLVRNGESSAHEAADGSPERELDELEDEEEEDQRSIDGSSEGGDRDDHDLGRPSTSGTRTNSTSSTTNEGGGQGGTGGGNGAGTVPLKSQSAFVGKLWSMLYSPVLSDLITWTDDGKAFTVFHPTEFARAVLPQFFKHSNFASFIRQLNMYGFGKRVNDAPGGSLSQSTSDGSQAQAWEFQNPAFQRDRPDLLVKIRRKSAKSSAVASAPSNRRRPSIARAASSKPRREQIGSDGGVDEDEQAPRIGGTVQAVPSTPSMLFGDGSSGTGNGIKVVAGLTEFVPQGSHQDPRSQHRNRPKEDYHEGSVSRSPGSYVRHHAPYPPPPSSYYQHVGSHASPPGRSQLYPLPPTPFYPTARPPPPVDDPNTRQLAALEGQVRNLGDALLHTQQDYMAMRAASYSVLGILLGIVADMDVGEKRKEQIEACSSALSKLHPDNTIQGHRPQPIPVYPPTFSLPPSAQSQHPSTSYQNHYSRIPAAESYTRSSRPDSAHSHDQQALAVPANPLPLAIRSTPTPQPPLRPMSPPRPTTSGSNGAQPLPSGIAAQQGFPSPRSNWPSANPTSNRPTSLPSLSSLLEGVSANGERRPSEANARESEPPDERARKKLRQ